jgi:hypothetical protein
MKRTFSHGRNPQPRVPCFGLIFIGFACGKAKKLPEQGLAVDELLPALRFAAGVAVQDYVKNAL